MIKIANAPCSWGALEFDLEEKSEEIGYQQVLDEIKETGYLGTELGDWGYMPTEPKLLRHELEIRDIELLGAFVPVALVNQKKHSQGVADALKTAELMFRAGFKDTFIVLADENGTVSQRTKNAGRIAPGMGLTNQYWETFAKGAEDIARAVKDTFGIRTVFHHHCAGFVETPEEVDKLMSMTDPELLGLCLDMGHYMFGGGNPLNALKKYASRIWHIHFKDFDPRIAELSSAVNGDYCDAVRRGVFCPLGQGAVEFDAIVSYLRKLKYSGWIVVEQDVLPGMGEPKESAQQNRDFLKNLGL